MNEKLQKYRDFLIEENKKINLTAITDPKEIEIKHFKDSLTIKDYVKGRVLDIGSGAGFPGIVLKIDNDNLDVTLIDSVGKKVNFMNEAIELLELKNIRAIHVRAEDYAKDEREKFDTVTSRAVSNLTTLSEYAIPFLKIGGRFIAMKGPKADIEVKKATNAIKKLGGKIIDIKKIEFDGNERNIVIIEKIKKTPKRYPRGQNKPLKNPIS